MWIPPFPGISEENDVPILRRGPAKDVVEPYNATLSVPQLVKNPDETFCIDN